MPSAQTPPLDDDEVLCECALEPLQEFVAGLERAHQVDLRREPAVCMVMVRAQDSLEAQEFCLGEALATECEVAVDGHAGFGLCLGDEPVRAYCLAVLDALLNGASPQDATLARFLDEQRRAVETRDQEEFELVLRTQVDFKLMEEE